MKTPEKDHPNRLTDCTQAHTHQQVNECRGRGKKSYSKIDTFNNNERKMCFYIRITPFYSHLLLLFFSYLVVVVMVAVKKNMTFQSPINSYYVYQLHKRF